jgi:hypothetical protein
MRLNNLPTAAIQISTSQFKPPYVDLNPKPVSTPRADFTVLMMIPASTVHEGRLEVPALLKQGLHVTFRAPLYFA